MSSKMKRKGADMRKTIIIAIAIAAVALIGFLASTLFFPSNSKTGVQEGNNTAENAPTPPEPNIITSIGTSEQTTTIPSTNSNTTQNQENTGKTTNTAQEGKVSVTWNNNGIVQNDQTMDRQKLIATATAFVQAYYATDDVLARKTALGNLLDVAYLTEHQDSILYYDYVKDSTGTTYAPINSTLLWCGNAQINNAQAPNASVRIDVQLSNHMHGQDGGADFVETQTTTMTVKISSEYKVQEYTAA